MDERYRKSLLYDFYGELLNEHQKQVFSAAIFDDMSYSELADEFGCSRQAAFDLVKRISNKLENYESKMGLLKRFTEAKDKMIILTSTVEDIKESLFSQQDNVILMPGHGPPTTLGAVKAFTADFQKMIQSPQNDRVRN